MRYHCALSPAPMTVTTSGVFIISPARRVAAAFSIALAAHTVHTGWPSWLKLGKQVSRRHAPRARLRTGLDPATHVINSAPYPKGHGVVSQIDVVSVPPTDRAGGQRHQVRAFANLVWIVLREARRRWKEHSGWRKQMRCRRSRSAILLQRRTTRRLWIGATNRSRISERTRMHPRCCSTARHFFQVLGRSNCLSRTMHHLNGGVNSRQAKLASSWSLS